MLDVPDVEFDPLLPRDPRAPMDLGPAGDPRPQIQSPELTRRVELDLGWERRARTDDPHLAAQHVDQVRQLVERITAQEPADPRHPRVLRRDGGADPDRVDPLAHGAELEQVEDDAVLADAPLPVEDRSRRFEPDRDRR